MNLFKNQFETHLRVCVSEDKYENHMILSISIQACAGIAIKGGLSA